MVAPIRYSFNLPKIEYSSQSEIPKPRRSEITGRAKFEHDVYGQGREPCLESTRRKIESEGRHPLDYTFD